MSLDDGYVSPDYLKQVAERVRNCKALSYEHMAINPGDSVLDIGCGPGVDSASLAALVGESGRVIGIDHDPAMLAEADTAAQAGGCAARIEHRQGSATDLPLENGAVASCRAERLLQVMAPELEQSVVAEMVRVTRRKGRVVLIDTDWGSASVDFSDPRLERRLMGFFALQMRPNGLAGRRLPALCREQGLGEIRIDVLPMVQLRLEETPFGQWLVDTAISAEMLAETEATLWLDELRQRESEQRFYASVNMVIASGCKGAA